MTRLRLFKMISLPLLAAQVALAGCAAPQKQSVVETTDKAPVSAKGGALSQPDERAPTRAAASAKGVELCPMEISNPPPLDRNGKVIGGPLVAVKGVTLLLQPATNVCLSSGYGERNGRPHRGVDYHTRTQGDVLAAGDGIILEAMTRADFGVMVVIDHGAGVYTRYAHLASFSDAASEGATVGRGDILGPIGATGATSVRHLHFEIMTGAYVKGVGTFGLSTHNPFGLPPP